MFSNGFPKEWSTLRKLTWLYRTVINAVSAVLKTIIGNPIHITDALAKPVQALSIALEPIQDLHGYDNPWPAGGGKNILNPDKRTETSQNIYYYQSDGIVLEAGTYTLSISGGNAAGLYIQKKADSSTVAVKYNATALTFTLAEDTSVYVNVYYSPAPSDISAIKCQLEAGSTATAWSPYKNECPITGHTGLNVYGTGKNLLADEDIYVGKNYNGNNNAQRSMIYVQAPIGTYTVSVQDKTSFAELNIGRTDMVYGSMNRMHGIVGTPETSWTITTNEQYPIICVFLRNASDAMTLEQINAAQIQVELGSTATSYSAFVGTTYPIPLGQTVYGGTVDTVAGVLPVEWVFYEYDGDEDWISGTNYFALFNQQPSVGNNDLTQIANWLKGAGNGYAKYGGFRAQSNGAVVVGKTGGPWADTNAFKATLAQTPLQVCYKLATPMTIQLTPQQVELLQGENNLWSDGTITMTYLADGNASDVEALNILLGGRYVNNHTEDEPTDREALDILLGRTR